MKVNGSGLGRDLIRIYAEQLKEKEKLRQQEAVAKVSTTDKPAQTIEQLEISPRARILHEQRQLLAALPAVRSEKVERLRAEIVSGSYRPDPEAIAAGMRAQWLLDRKA